MPINRPHSSPLVSHTKHAGVCRTKGQAALLGRRTSENAGFSLSPRRASSQLSLPTAAARALTL